MTEELLTTFTWLIPAGPLLVFFLIVLFTNRNKTLSWLLAWAGVGLALVMGWLVALGTIFIFLEDGAHHMAEHPLVVHDVIKWLPVGRMDVRSSCFEWAFECYPMGSSEWLPVGRIYVL